MMKSMIVIALAAVLVNAAPAVDPSKRQQCVNEASAFIAKVDIAKPVERLVAISRQFYPHLEAMIMDEHPAREYEDALLRAGQQPGCEQIETHMTQLNDMVSCYNDMLEGDEDGLLDIARVNEGAQRVIEAYFACNFARPDYF